MKSIIVDNRISEKIERSLLRLGFFVMKAPTHPSLSAAIASHPDTLFFKLKNRLFSYADHTEAALPMFSDIREYHSDITFGFSGDDPSSVYPGDCALNALFIGGRIYAREKSLSPLIREFAEKEGLSIKGVNQGYPACSVLKINENSAITSDLGMAKAMSEDGIDVLLIEAGHIALPPHKYGFIGGASFVFSNKVCFFGDISKHPDCGKITDFIKGKSLDILSLSDEPLVDLGGAVIFE